MEGLGSSTKIYGELRAIVFSDYFLNACEFRVSPTSDENLASENI